MMLQQYRDESWNVVVPEDDSAEDHRPETLGSREESLDRKSHSSASKNHAERPYSENIHMSA